jgi:glycosyltransferase involved in cell wall biosynthesis
MKIFDVSNSKASLRNKAALYGPKENDIVRYLKQYAPEFGHQFVQSAEDADVIFTNDIFPEPFLGKRKVKRMDGVFSRADVVHRNEALNRAAQEADSVIFISEYSRESYFNLYDPKRDTIKSFTVIPNEVDPTVFYPSTVISEHPREMIAVASDWIRPEKRLNDLLFLARIAPETNFTLIGKVPEISYPKNIILKGYVDTPEKLGDALRMADGMVSLFYKDAYPKTMVQAKYCGLPVIFAGSGGQTQMGVAGVCITDTDKYSFDNSVPRLDPFEIEVGWKDFSGYFPGLKQFAMQYKGRNDFVGMLRSYFEKLQG